jgi:ketosteroid isomerase-like protein
MRLTPLLRCVLAVAIALSACQRSPATQRSAAVAPLTPSPELVEQTRAVYAAMSAGSASQVEALYSLADGAEFIGTGPTEFWTDAQQHNVDVRPYWQPGTLTVTPGEILAVAQGDMGFSVDRPSFRLRDGTVLQLRLTFVWRREAGGWRVVHSHASIAAS